MSGNYPAPRSVVSKKISIEPIKFQISSRPKLANLVQYEVSDEDSEGSALASSSSTKVNKSSSSEKFTHDGRIVGRDAPQKADSKQSRWAQEDGDSRTVKVVSQSQSKESVKSISNTVLNQNAVVKSTSSSTRRFVEVIDSRTVEDKRDSSEHNRDHSKSSEKSDKKHHRHSSKEHHHHHSRKHRSRSKESKYRRKSESSSDSDSVEQKKKHSVVNRDKHSGITETSINSSSNVKSVVCKENKEYRKFTESPVIDSSITRKPKVDDTRKALDQNISSKFFQNKFEQDEKNRDDKKKSESRQKKGADGRYNDGYEEENSSEELEYSSFKQVIKNISSDVRSKITLPSSVEAAKVSVQASNLSSRESKHLDSSNVEASQKSKKTSDIVELDNEYRSKKSHKKKQKRSKKSYSDSSETGSDDDSYKKHEKFYSKHSQEKQQKHHKEYKESRAKYVGREEDSCDKAREDSFDMKDRKHKHKHRDNIEQDKQQRSQHNPHRSSNEIRDNKHREKSKEFIDISQIDSDNSVEGSSDDDDDVIFVNTMPPEQISGRGRIGSSEYQKRVLERRQSAMEVMSKFNSKKLAEEKRSRESTDSNKSASDQILGDIPMPEILASSRQSEKAKPSASVEEKLCKNTGDISIPKSNLDSFRSAMLSKPEDPTKSEVENCAIDMFADTNTPDKNVALNADSRLPSAGVVNPVSEASSEDDTSKRKFQIFIKPVRSLMLQNQNSSVNTSAVGGFKLFSKPGKILERSVFNDDEDDDDDEEQSESDKEIIKSKEVKAANSSFREVKEKYETARSRGEEIKEKPQETGVIKERDANASVISDLKNKILSMAKVDKEYSNRDDSSKKSERRSRWGALPDGETSIKPSPDQEKNVQSFEKLEKKKETTPSESRKELKSVVGPKRDSESKEKKNDDQSDRRRSFSERDKSDKHYRDARDSRRKSHSRERSRRKSRSREIKSKRSVEKSRSKSQSKHKTDREDESRYKRNDTSSARKLNRFDSLHDSREKKASRFHSQPEPEETGHKEEVKRNKSRDKGRRSTSRGRSKDKSSDYNVRDGENRNKRSAEVIRENTAATKSSREQRRSKSRENLHIRQDSIEGSNLVSKRHSTQSPAIERHRRRSVSKEMTERRVRDDERIRNECGRDSRYEDKAQVSTVRENERESVHDYDKRNREIGHDKGKSGEIESKKNESHSSERKRHERMRPEDEMEERERNSSVFSRSRPRDASFDSLIIRSNSQAQEYLPRVSQDFSAHPSHDIDMRCTPRRHSTRDHSPRPRSPRERDHSPRIRSSRERWRGASREFRDQNVRHEENMQRHGSMEADVRNRVLPLPPPGDFLYGFDGRCRERDSTGFTDEFERGTRRDRNVDVMAENRDSRFNENERRDDWSPRYEEINRRLSVDRREIPEFHEGHRQHRSLERQSNERFESINANYSCDRNEGRGFHDARQGDGSRERSRGREFQHGWRRDIVVNRDNTGRLCTEENKFVERRKRRFDVRPDVERNLSVERVIEFSANLDIDERLLRLNNSQEFDIQRFDEERCVPAPRNDLYDENDETRRLERWHKDAEEFERNTRRDRSKDVQSREKEERFGRGRSGSRELRREYERTGSRSRDLSPHRSRENRDGRDRQHENVRGEESGRKRDLGEDRGYRREFSRDKSVGRNRGRSRDRIRQRSGDRLRDGDRSGDRFRDGDGSGDRFREKENNRNWNRQRSRDRDRSSRERGRSRERFRSRERQRSRERERSINRKREGERRTSRDRERERSRAGERQRSKDRDRSIGRQREGGRRTSRDRERTREGERRTSRERRRSRTRSRDRLEGRERNRRHSNSRERDRQPNHEPAESLYRRRESVEKSDIPDRRREDDSRRKERIENSARVEDRRRQSRGKSADRECSKRSDVVRQGNESTYHQRHERIGRHGVDSIDMDVVTSDEETERALISVDQAEQISSVSGMRQHDAPIQRENREFVPFSGPPNCLIPPPYGNNCPPPSQNWGMPPMNHVPSINMQVQQFQNWHGMSMPMYNNQPNFECGRNFGMGAPGPAGPMFHPQPNMADPSMHSNMPWQHRNEFDHRNDIVLNNMQHSRNESNKFQDSRHRPDVRNSGEFRKRFDNSLERITESAEKPKSKREQLKAARQAEIDRINKSLLSVEPENTCVWEALPQLSSNDQESLEGVSFEGRRSRSDSLDHGDGLSQPNKKFKSNLFSNSEPSDSKSSKFSTPDGRSDADLDKESSLSAKPEKMKSRWRRWSELESENRPPLDQHGDDSDSMSDVLSSGKMKNDEGSKALKDSTNEKPEENKMPYFEQIEDNIFLSERDMKKARKEARRMLCDCALPSSEELKRGTRACGEDCLNRMLFIECGSRCACGDKCSNKMFQKRDYANVRPFQTDWKGWGLQAAEELHPGTFIMEYIGEVLDYKEFKYRTRKYAAHNAEHHYFMALSTDEIIDAAKKGNVSRLINHSCDPNAETQKSIFAFNQQAWPRLLIKCENALKLNKYKNSQAKSLKWTVNGQLRVGFFAIKTIAEGEEITFNYQFQYYGDQAMKCFCGASNCRGIIGSEKIVPLKSRSRYKSKNKDKKLKSELFSDIYFDEEIDKLLSRGGLQNKDHVLELNRLMLRAENIEHRISLLKVLQNTSAAACLRLFLDYHGLPLLWSWMVDAMITDIEFKKQSLEVLKILPIGNITVLRESKILTVVQKWSEEVLPPPVSTSVIFELKDPDKISMKRESLKDDDTESSGSLTVSSSGVLEKMKKCRRIVELQEEETTGSLSSDGEVASTTDGKCLDETSQEPTPDLPSNPEGLQLIDPEALEGSVTPKGEQTGDKSVEEAINVKSEAEMNVPSGIDNTGEDTDSSSLETGDECKVNKIEEMDVVESSSKTETVKESGDDESESASNSSDGRLKDETEGIINDEKLKDETEGISNDEKLKGETACISNEESLKDQTSINLSDEKLKGDTHEKELNKPEVTEDVDKNDEQEAKATESSTSSESSRRSETRQTSFDLLLSLASDGRKRLKMDAADNLFDELYGQSSVKSSASSESVANNQGDVNEQIPHSVSSDELSKQIDKSDKIEQFKTAIEDESASESSVEKLQEKTLDEIVNQENVQKNDHFKEIEVTSQERLDVSATSHDVNVDTDTDNVSSYPVSDLVDRSLIENPGVGSTSVKSGATENNDAVASISSGKNLLSEVTKVGNTTSGMDVAITSSTSGEGLLCHATIATSCSSSDDVSVGSDVTMPAVSSTTSVLSGPPAGVIRSASNSSMGGGVPSVSEAGSEDEAGEESKKIDMLQRQQTAKVQELATELLSVWKNLKELYRIPKKVVEDRKKREEELDKRVKEPEQRVDTSRHEYDGWDSSRKRKYDSTPSSSDLRNKRKRSVDERKPSVGDTSDDSRASRNAFSKPFVTPPMPKITKQERRLMFEARVRAEEEELKQQQQQQQQLGAVGYYPAAVAAVEGSQIPSLVTTGPRRQPKLPGPSGVATAVLAEPIMDPPCYTPFNDASQQNTFIQAPQQPMNHQAAAVSADIPLQLMYTQQLPYMPSCIDQSAQSQTAGFVHPGYSVDTMMPGYAQPYSTQPITYNTMIPGDLYSMPQPAPEPALVTIPQYYMSTESVIEQINPPPPDDPTIFQPPPPPPPSPPRPKGPRLPPNWKTAKDTEGKTYFYHTVTRQTQWDAPLWDGGQGDDDESLAAAAAAEFAADSSDTMSTRPTTAAADTSSEEISRKLKEGFRAKISKHIITYLNPYHKIDCNQGRITNSEDFKHLARKITHAILNKELKHCRHLEDLEVNENVKGKAKDYVAKYMSRFGTIYKPTGSP